MKIELEFAELHNDLFFIGKNFGKKLDHKKYAGISLTYDDAHDWLVVGWNGRETWVPLTNVGNMTPKGEDKPAVAAVASIVTPRSGAQASSPTEHVFAGPGAGKTK